MFFYKKVLKSFNDFQNQNFSVLWLNGNETKSDNFSWDIFNDFWDLWSPKWMITVLKEKYLSTNFFPYMLREIGHIQKRKIYN